MNIPKHILELIRQWTDIEGYEGLYQVSRLGEVRSIDHYSRTSRGNGKRLQKGKILKPCKLHNYKDINDYERVGINNNSELIHRLVAKTFIPNPYNLPYINHKDEIKYNNYVWNLEWCTPKYNSNYGTSIQRMKNSKKGYKVSDETKLKLSKAFKGENHPNYGKRNSQANKSVLCVELGIVFDSMSDANEFLGKDRYSPNISACCRGLQPRAYGYHWEIINNKKEGK